MVRYIYWCVDGTFLGYIEDYPDYWTQGDTLEKLEENLSDIYTDVTGGDIPFVRKVGELQLTTT